MLVPVPVLWLEGLFVVIVLMLLGVLAHEEAGLVRVTKSKPNKGTHMQKL